MNEESNERNTFFRGLIVKILLVLLFVFLLMWLFPMPNLSPFYDKIFAANMDTMTEAAKSYYTVERLPEEEGETKKLTLKEMLDNKMIMEFTDSDGNTCDVDKSYVEVTKQDGEYIFKTNLSCDTQEDYVIEYFGCYDVCEDDTCKVEETEEIIEYQFYKIVKEKLIDKYVCSDGYTLSGTKCILKTTIEDEEEAELVCSSGYTYNEATEQCEKKVTEDFDAYKKCPSGYIYATSMDKCIMSSSTTEPAEESYNKCSDGSEPVNGICTIKTVVTTDADEEVYCENGTLSDDETTCILEEPATTSYSCTKGDLVGDQCKITNTVTTYDYTKWVCSYVYYISYQDTISTDTHTLNYEGYDPVLEKDKYQECYRTLVASTSTTYSYVPATSSYNCPSGYDLEGTTCVLEEDPIVEESCKDGSTPVNGICSSTVTNTTPATTKYSCSEGTLSGTVCIIPTTDKKDYTLYCPYGILNGTKCVITTTDKKDPTYECPDDYTQCGNMCYKLVTSTKTENATVIYKTVSTKTYKWSTSKTLAGWTATGKTRTVTVSK